MRGLALGHRWIASSKYCSSYDEIVLEQFANVQLAGLRGSEELFEMIDHRVLTPHECF